MLFYSPDQNPKVICEYVRESLAGRHAPLHTVAYDCSISATNVSFFNASNSKGCELPLFVNLIIK